MYSYLADVHDVFRDINVAELHKDRNQARTLLQRALSASASTNLTLQLLPSAAKLLASTDLVTKKLASWYIVRHSTADSDVSVLVVNTLVTDVHDPNPVIRSLAVRTLAQIKLPELVDHSISAVNLGLKDSDALVRRAAVLACVQIFRMVPAAVLDGGLVDCLYALIRDPDPVVVANCLCALQEILADEGGVVINRNMARYLLRRLDSFPEPQCATVIQLLTKYHPRDETEALDIMNTADILLDSSSAVIVVLALRYFLTVASLSGLAHLQTDILSRTENSLFRLLSSDAHETVYAVIQFMRQELVSRFTETLSHHCSAIMCHTNDPAYLKVAKIQLLADVADNSSVRAVLDELRIQARDKSPKVAEAAVVAVGKLASRFVAERAVSISDLVSLASDVTDTLVFTTLMHVLHKFDLRSHSDDVPKLLKVIEGRLDRSMDTESQCAMLSVLGESADLSDTGPYIVEQVLDSHCHRLPSNSQRLSCLLVASCRLFLRRPAQYQHILGRVLELCASSSDANVRDRAELYYALLSADIQLANTVLLSAAEPRNTTQH